MHHLTCHRPSEGTLLTLSEPAGNLKDAYQSDQADFLRGPCVEFLLRIASSLLVSYLLAQQRCGLCRRGNCCTLRLPDSWICLTVSIKQYPYPLSPCPLSWHATVGTDNKATATRSQGQHRGENRTQLHDTPGTLGGLHVHKESKLSTLQLPRRPHRGYPATLRG